MNMTSFSSTLSTTTTENNSKGIRPLYTTNDALNCTLVAMYALLGVLGAVGNLLVILAVWKNKPMRNPTNLLLSSVAVSDFIFMLISTPCSIIIVLAIETFTTLERSFIITTYISFATISSITLTLLATQRYNALVHPMKIQRRLTKRCAKIAICVIWISVFVLTSRACVVMELATKTPVSFYFIYISVWYTVTIFVPIAVIAFCYGKIITGVYVTKNICSQTTGQPQDISNKKKLTKMLLLITLVFVVGRIPIVVQKICADFMETTPSPDFYAVLRFLYNLSPCLNPIVYVAYNTNYRDGVRRLLRSCFCKLKMGSNPNLSPRSPGENRDKRDNDSF